ncbi:hypothetical protein HJC23_003808 [Cyclotella cryptica]|uniref:DUF6314 domain-containing protein n=1 Tax=Cyclotella cryptica TaxID=29204 RepID=A0ABD3PYS9_9STRA|eukprot:CCRYP_009956-RA/>CCRYP_009956-RA protein AED:0.31 eAED:0.31 QI:195/1/1/1/1/1/2/1373/730
MIEVAVIGAGTAGLVAARHLINAGLRPTIFEAAKTIGGAWTPSSSSAFSRRSADDDSNPSNDHPARKMWFGMHTNLSKYTCRFSDWPWSESASTFPSVEEMHEYLQSYSDCYLDANCNFQFECKVTNVEQLEIAAEGLSLKNGQSCYNVEWLDLKTQIKANKDFGGVVVATGFFNTPRLPSFLENYSKTIDEQQSNDLGNNKPEIIHSSEYLSCEALRNKNVAVIGSSFSALEIAADLSQTASRVVSVVPSVPWVMPRWIPKLESLQLTESSDATAHDATMTILPVDLAFYRRTEPFPQKEVVQLDSECCRKRHEVLRSIAGHKQQRSPLGEPSNWSEPPFVAISDEYLDLTREGRIEVVHGRLTGLNEDGSLCISNSQTIENIDTVVCCTGYTPHLHNFLSPSILEKLDYDPADTFSPLTLAWDVLHPSLPGLAFCGMYRGPYMGVMDLQARLAAGVMSGGLSVDEYTVQSALDTAQLIRKTSPRAQFPRIDYPGYMDSLAELCFGGKCPTHIFGGMVVPSSYQLDEEISRQCSLELQKEILRGQDGTRMPKLILQAILGNWTYDRHIVHMQTQKVERVSGTVKYTKYSRTSPQSTKEDDATAPIESRNLHENPVLYREDGLFELTPTQKFEVFREYEYISKYDALEIYFVEGGKRAHLFLSLKFVPETRQSDDGYWVKATSDHLCIKDLYSADFRVKLDGLSASEIVIKYRVVGPSKDYESTTVLKPL